MTTYSKETALYDTGAISDDIAEAGTTASKYITSVGNDGIKIHPYNETTQTADQYNYSKIDSDGMEIWQKPEGASASVKVAEFGADGSQIGLYADIGDTKVVITSGGFDLKKATGKSGHTIVSEKTVAHLGDDYATIGSRVIRSTIGDQSVVIGILCEASGYRSIAEGSGTVASGEVAHAEGANSVASEYASHAEGQSTTASGPEAHAEGNHTLASGYESHAQNGGTIAQGYRQTAIGSYNIAQGVRTGIRNTDYAFIIGNGNGIVDDPKERSNALTVDWSGRIKCGDYAGNFKNIFDIFYPKGSYYETSLPSAIPSGRSTPNATDLENLGTTWFNPNYAWGGTWVLEASGNVHVSSGTGYTLGATGGSPYIQKHTHGFTNPSVTGGSHSHKLGNTAANAAFVGMTGTTAGLGERQTQAASASNSRVPNCSDTNVDFVRVVNTTSEAHNHTVSGGSVNAVKDVTAGEGGNYPPYIVVNRWHRTA